MCGIVGFTGRTYAKDLLLQGLYTLEYRGYDSAGVALLDEEGNLQIVKRSGSVKVLEEALDQCHANGTTGIGHTRWATHGAPNEANAHPHTDCNKTLAIVHNGIIENHYTLREELVARGHVFASETDTEVIAHLLEEEYAKAQGNLYEAFRATIAQLEGAYALVALHKDHPGELMVARNGSPIVCASTPQGAYVASDMLALAAYTSTVITLDNGQYAHLFKDGTVEVFNADGTAAVQELMHVDESRVQVDNGDFPDFMMKEIFEQPEAIEHLLKGRLVDGRIMLDDLNISDEEIANTDRVFIVACGTSYHAGLVAKNYIERLAKIPVEVSVASEFNYQDQLVTEHTLCIIVTQSGETADTLTSARKIKSLGARVFAITNVIGSTAAREADGVLYTKAGSEVSVASTKSYVAQIVALFMVSLFLAEKKGLVSPAEIEGHYRDLLTIPNAIRTVLKRVDQPEAAAALCEGRPSALFLGRGLNWPTASEGALKLKELSYVHAEAYPAGEMKHGPIALLEKGFPVFVIIPNDDTRSKTLSNIEEISARGASVAAVATDGDPMVSEVSQYVMWVPAVPELLTPLICIIPLQVLSRQIAINRGQNVDRPRNLAKSVTVE